MKGISIIIPTINRDEDLRNTIDFLLQQDYPKFEIYVIDQSQEKNDISNLDERIRYIYRPDISSASAARNLGLATSTYDYVLFLDDDVIINNEDYLGNIVGHLSEADCVGVSGPILPVANPVSLDKRHVWSFNKRWGWLFFPRNYAQSCMINDAGAGNLAVRKDYALSVGGMDEQFIKGAHREESDFNMRYTGRYGWYNYEPDCALIHIGRREGGVRSWDTIRSKAIKAQHHFDGAWYFMFKNVRWYDWPPHLLSMFMFFFYRRAFLRRPDWFLIALWRFSVGKINGLRMRFQGPKYLKV